MSRRTGGRDRWSSPSPKDMLIERVAVADAPPFNAIETSPGAAEMEKFAQMLGAARAPIILLGGSRWSQEACDRVARFAEKYSLPVATTFRRGHLFDADASLLCRRSRHRSQSETARTHQGGGPGHLVGGRIGELPSQSYTLFDIPRPQMPFVHVHPAHGRARPRLQSASGDQCHADGLRRGP